MIPSKRFDMFPPDWGMLKRSFRCVPIFSLEKQVIFDVLFPGTRLEKLKSTTVNMASIVDRATNTKCCRNKNLPLPKVPDTTVLFTTVRYVLSLTS